MTRPAPESRRIDTAMSMISTVASCSACTSSMSMRTDQEACRHVLRLEMDADHRAELELDEQQQNVVDGRAALHGPLDLGKV